ncbi:SDR family NAD(P)-dependent oxidoreductase [Novosphingobium mangrovi (ex Huang et al. 2023)]|uniref:SDR family oxidoreductase n=1 Tax=Novosphingobium mangrovi (ex Huang et al. 2023) TaxID=2976432 RepID=A0ABT2I509_9SPHN|nr:SDR family oxidoreductase [Novosphingobium mangrovi (ex Huang et al. 2023)]MCT2399880.1 SDR family oxidoreductase [Novosphingobium mangrovi (ex Huang et al. 2023)]
MTTGTSRLAGKVAIITGGGQGIGAAIAEACAREGARVLITGRTQGKLDDVAHRITAAGGTCTPFVATAGDRVQSLATVERAMADWGRLDVLVNNAHSFTDYLPLTDPKMEENCKVDFQSAFFGSLQLMQLCHPHMVEQGGGSIINFGSSYGIRCEPGFLAYAASKEAIRTLTRTAAKEWGPQGIRVNTILPSAMSPKALWYLEESKTYDAELSKVAIGRFGKPGDIAPTAVFLASDESAYVTGQTIGVDGGSTML